MTLPDDFIAYTRRMMGDVRWNGFLRALDEEPPVSIRTNPLKPADRAFRSVAAVPWCPGAFFLDGRPKFTADPLFHAGTYYVQEAASMFLWQVMRRYVTRPVLMLDLCAAPGGKSTLARSILPRGSVLVSNEPVRPRAAVLAENMQKWGHPDVIVTSCYPDAFSRCDALFDVILADVPCSGEGMFRKDRDAVAGWNVRNVAECRNLQRRIIGDIWHSLRPGGLLIYSTCTYNTSENEENVAYIAGTLGADILPVDIDDAWGITGSLLEGFSAPVCRFIPGCTQGEGLFMAVLRKHDDRTASHGGRRPRKKKLRRPTDAGVPRHWLKNADDFVFHVRDTVTAIPRSWNDIWETLDDSLDVIHAGIRLGRIKGRDIIPAQSLAMSVCLNGDAFTAVEIDRPTALAYLSRETVTLPHDSPRGNILLTYGSRPLGFVRNIGNRANNLYPSEWKIRNRNI